MSSTQACVHSHYYYHFDYACWGGDGGSYGPEQELTINRYCGECSIQLGFIDISPYDIQCTQVTGPELDQLFVARNK